MVLMSKPTGEPRTYRYEEFSVTDETVSGCGEDYPI